jgi:chromosome segregation protein
VTLESLAADRAGAAARVESLDQRVQSIVAEIEQLQSELRNAERESTHSSQSARSAAGAKDKAEDGRKDAAGALEAARRGEAQQEKERSETAQELSRLRARMAGLEARRDSLREAYEAAARIEGSLEKAAGSGRLRWEGRLSSALRVPDMYARALAAALGPFAEAFGFPTEGDLGSGLQVIEEGDAELEGAMVRLDAQVPGPRVEPLADPECLGNAADLVEAAPRYRNAVEALLGRTLVVRDRQAARRLLGRLTGETRLVTLSGEVFHSSGHVLFGEGRRNRPTSKAAHTAGEEAERVRRDTDAVEQRLAALEAEREVGRSRSAHALEALDRASEDAHRAQAEHFRSEAKALSDSQRVSFLQARLESQQSEQNLQHERLAAERRRLEEVGSAYARLEVEMKRADLVAGGEAAAVRLAQLESLLQLTKSALDDAEARAAELEGTRSERLAESESRKTRRRTLEAEHARLQVDVAEAGRGMQAIEERLQALAGEAAPAEAELVQTEQTRAGLEQEETRLRADLQAAERGHAQAQIELARREEELSSLQRRVEDDFGLVAFDFDESATVQDVLPIEGLVEHLPQVDNLPPELEGQVNRLRLQLRRMGAINPEAQREYLEVKERVEFLGTQLGDLRKAEGQLQSVIGELDQLMEHEFQKTFEAVGAEFRRAFTRLFGGGSVRLSLTDPDDLTSTGIDIEARLPGRREQGLPMLSGGERSLTACALVFALLKVSPTPFCVLDEVDAMLDESNVARFREMLHELAAETQFIVITHNRQTVQAADVIYGVSMGPDSASRVISLRLDEAEREMAA